ncbi:MAG: hypothetical protein [Circular genetic element sp.]|jgi:hypothetical protein|nr:MAG: hypothetical protein [Circular genetic element sp.]
MSERLDDLERTVGVLIGLALGGPAGARLGNSAVSLHQQSPLHHLETALIDDLETRLDQRRIAGRTRVPSKGGPRALGVKKKRKASAYSKRYGKCFKKLQSKYKKKNGEWKKDGFKRCAAAARRCAK